MLSTLKNIALKVLGRLTQIGFSHHIFIYSLSLWLKLYKLYVQKDAETYYNHSFLAISS